MTTAKTKLFGVFGYPVGHTMSPTLHSILAKETNQDISYLAFSASPEEFPEKFEAAKLLGDGFNITVPHKINVMEHLDVISEDARIIGAVNTCVKKNGKWYGYNTDGQGFLKSLSVNNIDIQGKDILMLGAGGACRSVAYTLAVSGAKSITIEARTQSKADEIGNIITSHSLCKYWRNFCNDRAYDIIINTTPLGMHPYEDKNPFEYYSVTNENTVCYDLIYSPWETLFLQESKKHGAKTLNGFEMLCYQGILAYSHFTEMQFADSFYREICTLFLNEFRK